MEPWIIDASDIIKGEEYPIEKDDIVTNKKIETFINNEYLRNVVAPKGFGKTFLLLYKRLEYTKFGIKNGYSFIPKNNPIDSSSTTEFGYSNLMDDFYSNHSNWENLWKSCISLSLIKLLIKEEDDLTPKHYLLYNEIKDIKNFEKYALFEELLYNTHYEDPTEYLKHIIIYFSPQQIRKLLAEENFLNHIIKDIEIPIVIFIDNVDELFRDYLKEFKEKYNPDGKTKNIWHLAQQGLVLAAKDMCRTVRHLDMYVSIRKEAFDVMDDDLLENLRSSTIVLQYSKDDLENIFKKNIKWTDKKSLFMPEKQDTDPIMSFFGFNKIRNKHHGGEEEDIFDYIYRHTLKRPRDVVHIGKELSNLSTAERQNPEKVREKVNETATRIAEDYINIFVRYTDFKDTSEIHYFLKMIPYNILSWEHIVKICSRFNNGCDNKNCEGCNKKHPFCSLFQLGLLGVTYFDAEGQCKQKFLCPGEERFKTKHVLRKDSNSKNKVYYLIHPILNVLIGGDPETNKDKTTIIGDGREFKKDFKFPEFMQIKQIKHVFLCHSEKDKDFVDKVYKDLQNDVSLWYDKYNIKVGDSIADKIEEGIDNSDYLVIFISKNSIDSGWVKKELDAGVQKEIENKKVFVLPARIDEIDKKSWKKLPSCIRGKRYADFRKGYEEEGLKDLKEAIGIVKKG